MEETVEPEEMERQLEEPVEMEETRVMAHMEHLDQLAPMVHRQVQLEEVVVLVAVHQP